MKNRIAIAICITLAQPAASFAACTTEPALELRNAFIKGYAGNAASKGGAIDTAAKEGGCMFDVMAEHLTVKSYITVAKGLRDGKEPGPELTALLPEIKKRCISRN